MLRYLREPELRARHGAAARARVEREFDAKGHAGALLDEMRRAAARDRP